jgi:putative copper export protein
MSTYRVVHFLHLVAAATWLGGMITLAVVVGALRRAGVERAGIVAAARAFARVSWPALIVAIATGLAQVHMLHLPWSYRPLHVKVGLVAVTTLVALVHVRFARRLAPAARGALEATLLLLTLAIVAAAVTL